MAEASETTQVSGAGTGPEHEELLGAVRALSTQVGDLRAEVQALRSTSRALPVEAADVHGWEQGVPVAHDGSAWVRSLDGPAARSPAVPRLALELVFLVGVALLAALAELAAPVIAVVMAGAWGLVAAAEWSAWRAARHRDAMIEGVVFHASTDGDAAWFAPVDPTGSGSTEVPARVSASLPPPPSE